MLESIMFYGVGIFFCFIGIVANNEASYCLGVGALVFGLIMNLFPDPVKKVI